MSASTDLANALESVAGVARPIVEAGCDLLTSLFGRPCQVGGELIADQLYAWQWENRVRIAAKARERLTSRGIEPKVLPAGFLMPLVAAAGNIEDPKLQEMWANLLAAGVESAAHQHPGFIHVLQQLSRSEATLLDIIARDCFRLDEVFYRDASSSHFVREDLLPTHYPLNKLNVDEKELRSILSHLSSLGLVVLTIETEPIWTKRESSKIMTGKKRFTYANATRFGQSFLAACCGNGVAATLGVKESFEVTQQAADAAHAAESAASALRSSLDDLELSIHEIKDVSEEAQTQAEEAQTQAEEASKKVDKLRASRRASQNK